MQIIAGPTGISYAQDLCELIETKPIIPEYKIFPDGESYIRLPEIQDEETLVIQTCSFPQDSNLFQLLNLINTIRETVTEKVTCFIPYLCYARADRAVRSGEAVTIETVFRLLEAVGVDHLIVLDIHNPDVFSYTTMETTNIYPAISIRKFLEETIQDFSDYLVLAPDEGAVERAEKLATELGTPFTHLQKYRDPESGSVSLKLGKVNLSKPNVILVDDIISTGGTLVKASNLLKIQGVEQIHYVISHAMGTDAVEKLREIGNGLVVATDSTKSIIGHISVVPDLIKVLPV